MNEIPPISELPDGSLELIDGHLRAETVGDAEVPVLVLDVTEDEADKLLVTLDPLAAMATVDADALASLVATVETDSDALRQMIDDLASEAGITSPEFSPATLDDQSALDEKAKIQCPECGHEFTT